MSADKYDESLHKLIAGSTPLKTDKASECFLSKSLGFDIPPTQKCVTKSGVYGLCMLAKESN